ncbi:MAG: hypothetical protein WCH59_04870 [Chitinophagia bacterium]|jgi:hypothetical protein
MKQFRKLIRPMFAIILMIGLSSSVPISKEVSVNDKTTEKENTSENLAMTNLQFLKLTPQSYYQLTGIKMSFKERMALKFAQKEVRSSIKKKEVEENGAVNLSKTMESGKRNFRFGAFLLGLFLGLIGVALAYIFTTDKVYIKSAWKGFATWIAIVLLFWVI